MTATLLLGEYVNLTGELGVRSNGTRSAEYLTAYDVLTLDAAEKNTDVVASLAVVHGLAEHLDAGSGRLLGLLDADNLNGGVELELATLYTAGSNGTTTGDGHNVLDGHRERLLVVANRGRNVGIDLMHELTNGPVVLLIALECLESRTLNDGKIIAGEVVLVEELTGLHLDELDELLVVNHVALVEEDDDVRNAYLTCEQDVLTSLSHGAVGSSDNQNSTVHLSSTGNHVLDVVSVTRAVYVSIVTLGGLILYVSNGDRNTTLTLLGSLVDVLKCGEVCLAALGLRKNLGDCGSQGSLAVVDVTNRTDVYMRLTTLKLLFGHCRPPLATNYGHLKPLYVQRRRSAA